MADTYDSVLDRIGAFNAATEKLAKGKLKEVHCVVATQPQRWMRLLKTDDNYRFELGAGEVPSDKEPVLLEMKFAREGDVYRRDVRKAERSWNVASQMEDILAEVFGLPINTAVSVEVSGEESLEPEGKLLVEQHWPDIHPTG